VYTIDPDGFGTFKVWCDMQNNKGWTVFQKRQDGSVYFYRGWSDYKVGFGKLTGEFWLGLDKIHRLTKSGQSFLRIEMTYHDGTNVDAMYTDFSVAAESGNYKLNVGDLQGKYLRREGGREGVYVVFLSGHLSKMIVLQHVSSPLHCFD
jgi:ficolin